MYFSNKAYRIIFLGVIAFIILIVFNAGCISKDSGKKNVRSESNITFVTSGSTFSPIITVTGSPEIQWVFGDGSTSDSTSPSVNFSSKKIRTNSLVVTPWSSVTKINIGYDGSQGGVAPGPDTIENLTQQNVVAVIGLENVAPYLQIWASSRNKLNELNFSNFTSLNTIECFSCHQLSTIKLQNVPSLTRLCIENCNISYLDLSEAPCLEDLRVANQHGSTFAVNWGTTGVHARHICIRDDRFNATTRIQPWAQFPNVRHVYYMDNGLTQSEVDNMLRIIDGFNTSPSYAIINITGNAAPSATGLINITNLQSRGWNITYTV